MIIWLASYPKSGNTMLRSMLSAYLFSSDGLFNFDLMPNIKQFPNKTSFEQIGVNIKDHNEIIKNSIKAQETFNNPQSVGFMKTHNLLFNYNKKYPFTNLNNTLGVVYIVRDPRNVLLSYARHLNLPIEKVIKYITKGKGNGIDIMGNWAENFLSWKSLKLNNRYLLIKYEDLISKREETFLKIIRFIYRLRNMDFLIDQKKLSNMLKTTSFEYLKNLENKKSFNESILDKKTGNKIPFFHKGPSRDWSASLEKNQSDQLEKLFKNEMKELGYL